jgi:hypothetical protein
MVHPKIREDQQSHKSDKENKEIRESRKTGESGKLGKPRKLGVQQIRPHFQNNYVNENYDGYFEDNMKCCDDKETKVFFTKEEHDQFMDVNEIFMQDEEERFSIEREDYQIGLHNVIMQFQRQYNL